MKQNRQYNSIRSKAGSAALSLLVGAGLLVTAESKAALLGNPYTPTGASFTITAVQGIDSSHQTGTSGFKPQVNSDFEFKGTLGVAYDKGNGSLTDFGLGLYSNAAGQVQSTGLNIQLNQASLASTLSIRLADFDLKNTATFFNPNKVEPSILLFGANNSIYASATPQQIFSALTPVSGLNDYWDLNFSKLLSNLNKPDAAITGFLLYADQTAGERPNSDPYFLVSVGGGIPVIPEPSTYIGGLSIFALAIGAHARAVLKKKRMES